MTFYSLSNFLDSADVNKTVEGHPAPTRAIVTARLPYLSPLMMRLKTYWASVGVRNFARVPAFTDLGSTLLVYFINADDRLHGM